MPSNTYSKDHTKLFTGISETSKAWFIIHFLSVLIHFRIRTKHKIELHGNKKRISCYMFSIWILQKGRWSYKTTKLQKKAFMIYVYMFYVAINGREICIPLWFLENIHQLTQPIARLLQMLPSSYISKIYHLTIESKKAKPIEVVYWICLCEQDPRWHQFGGRREQQSL